MQTPPDTDPPGGRNLPAPTLWTEGMTHACENITLPQTSFTGGKKLNVVDIYTEYFQNSELQQEMSEKLGLSDSGHFWTHVKHFKTLL